MILILLISLFLLLYCLVVDVGNPDDADAGNEREELRHDQKELGELTLVIDSARDHVADGLEDQWDYCDEHEGSAHVGCDHDHP